MPEEVSWLYELALLVLTGSVNENDSYCKSRKTYLRCSNCAGNDAGVLGDHEVFHG